MVNLLKLDFRRFSGTVQFSGDINYKTFIANCVVCNEPIHKLIKDFPQNWQKEFQ